MTWSIPGRARGQARLIVQDRFERSDLEMLMSEHEHELEDPRLPPDLNDERYVFGILKHFEKKRQLPQFLEAVAQKLEEGKPDDPQAAQLRQIVESARPPEPKEKPPEKGSERPVGGTTIPPRRVRRIILLGEPAARSDEQLVEARENLAKTLAQAAFTAEAGGKLIDIVDWGDGWNGKKARPATLEDLDSLFVRVINSDIAEGDPDDLLTLPGKIEQKLRAHGTITNAQIVIWKCDGAEEAGHLASDSDSAAALNPAEADRGELRQALVQQQVAYRSDPAEAFVPWLRSRLNPDKWPPALRLLHPGPNKTISRKLIDLIEAITRGKCVPEYPEVTYLEPTTIDESQKLAKKLDDLISQDAARGGTIVAIHDLNLNLTGEVRDVIRDFHDTLNRYNDYLASIMTAKKIPDEKILKVGIIMIMANSFKSEEYPYQHRAEDWTLVFMKENGEMPMRQADEDRIKSRIEQLLQAG